MSWLAGCPTCPLCHSCQRSPGILHTACAVSFATSNQMLPAIVAEALAFLQQLLVRDRSGSEAEVLCDTVLEVRPSGVCAPLCV